MVPAVKKPTRFRSPPPRPRTCTFQRGTITDWQGTSDMSLTLEEKSEHRDMTEQLKLPGPVSGRRPSKAVPPPDHYTGRREPPRVVPDHRPPRSIPPPDYYSAKPAPNPDLQYQIYEPSPVFYSSPRHGRVPRQGRQPGTTSHCDPLPYGTPTGTDQDQREVPSKPRRTRITSSSSSSDSSSDSNETSSDSDCFVVEGRSPPVASHRERRRASPPPPKLPEFYGKPDEWSTFIFSFKNIARQYNWDDHKKLQRLKECLRRQAVEFVMNRRRKERRSFKKLIRCLKKRYGRMYDPYEQRQRLADIRQQAEESLDEFAERVYRTAAQGYKGSNEKTVQEMAVQAFLRGCKEKLAAMMASSHQRPKNITKALKRLKASLADQKAIWGRSMNLTARQVSFAGDHGDRELDVRNIQGGLQQTQGDRSRPRVPSPNLSPGLPRPRLTSDSPSRKEFEVLKGVVDQLVPKVERIATMHQSQAPRRNSGLCFECQGTGHFARDCPQSRSPSPDRSRSPGRNSCFYCKGVGHWARDCFQRQRDQGVGQASPERRRQRDQGFGRTSPERRRQPFDNQRPPSNDRQPLNDYRVSSSAENSPIDRA